MIDANGAKHTSVNGDKAVPDLTVLHVAASTITASDTAIIGATLLGPILAVQAQKAIERANATRERRLAIFRTLMATRATRISPAFVEAFNAVPIEFYGPRKPKLKSITDDWRTYFDLFNDRVTNQELMAVRRLDAFTDMLHKIALYLGYRLSRSEMLAVYHPDGHVTAEMEGDVIRRGFASIFAGKGALPIMVRQPSDEQ